ncbi:MAG TPA: transposase zinc-binding domain-containing protein [Candidatus Limnocylindria bacterium]|nr:transposase zinc-binding domain-containing protein [Candidatus Limnocylindria bacterium]
MFGLGYAPRSGEQRLLHGVVCDHLETFLAEIAARSDGHGLPSFVERESREFLGCGVLARGFARVRCGACAFERLVPFSCKGRGFCPSCGGRHMTEQAANLVDKVLPHVAVRQWVLSVPHRLRYLLAFDHRLRRAVLRVYVRALLGHHRRRTRRLPEILAVHGRANAPRGKPAARCARSATRRPSTRATLPGRSP